MDANEQNAMEDYDFSTFQNVELTGIKLDDLSHDELSVLYQQARYCQAMTDADIDIMKEIVSEDTTFTHMSGTYWYEKRGNIWIAVNEKK